MAPLGVYLVSVSSCWGVERLSVHLVSSLRGLGFARPSRSVNFDEALRFGIYSRLIRSFVFGSTTSKTILFTGIFDFLGIISGGQHTELHQFDKSRVDKTRHLSPHNPRHHPLLQNLHRDKHAPPDVDHPTSRRRKTSLEHRTCPNSLGALSRTHLARPAPGVALTDRHLARVYLFRAMG